MYSQEKKGAFEPSGNKTTTMPPARAHERVHTPPAAHDKSSKGIGRVTQGKQTAFSFQKKNDRKGKEILISSTEGKPAEKS